jgi:predicted ABC-type ATPase
LGFDQVMQAMPDYQSYSDPVEAFAALELPAREQGYQMMEALLEKGQSFLFDNGGSASTHVDILKRAQSKGFRVVVVSICTAIQDAQKRVDVRAVQEGRHTPMNYLDDRATKIAALHEEYKSLTPFFFEMTNDGQDFAAFQMQCHEMARAVLRALEIGEGA